MRIINLESTKAVNAVQSISIDTNQISVPSINDTGESVYANVIVGEYNLAITLWSGEDYVNIGQWTDEQAEYRIKQILNV